MQVRSTYRFARISAFKAREVTREIQGLPASDALDLLRFVPKKAAGLVRKTLASAVANAENNKNLNVSDLVVREAVVGEGATTKRFQPKARGSAGPIRKRASHIRIVLTDEIEIKRREKGKAKGAKKSAPPKAGTRPARRSGKDKPATAKAEASAPAAGPPEATEKE